MDRGIDDGSGDLNQNGFQTIMDQIGVPISIVEAEAFFDKHGHSNGYMSHSKFINIITKQPKKQMADELQGLTAHELDKTGYETTPVLLHTPVFFPYLCAWECCCVSFPMCAFFSLLN